MQEGGGETGGDGSLGEASQGVALGLSGDEQEDASCVEDVGHPEGEAEGGTFGFVGEHGMAEGLGRQGGDVGVGLQRIVGFIETQVAIESETEDGGVDGAVGAGSYDGLACVVVLQ